MMFHHQKLKTPYYIYNIFDTFFYLKKYTFLLLLVLLHVNFNLDVLDSSLLSFDLFFLYFENISIVYCYLMMRYSTTLISSLLIIIEFLIMGRIISSGLRCCEWNCNKEVLYRGLLPCFYPSTKFVSFCSLM